MSTNLYPESYLLDSLIVRLRRPGRCAAVWGEASSDASNDLAGPTELATSKVRHFGMSVRLGPVGFSPPTSNHLSRADGRGHADAEGAQKLIDEEVADLLRDAEQRGTRVLSEHRRGLGQVGELLLERETSDGSAVEEAVAGHNGLVSSLNPGSAVHQTDRTIDERGDC